MVGPPALSAAERRRLSRSSHYWPFDNRLHPRQPYAGQNGLKLDRVVSEIASGLNDRRPKLLKLLSDPQVGTIIVEHRDRLARFGVGMVNAMLEARGGKLIVIDDAELADDLVRDMTEVLTCMCARLYGRRSAASRAKRAAMAAAEDADG